MLAILAATVLGSLVGSLIVNGPKYKDMYVQKKKDKELENILSREGTADNVHVDNLENVYLSDAEFSKYFGEGHSAKGYIKKDSGVTSVKTFINLDSGEETCPIIDYLNRETDRINGLLAPNAVPSAAQLDGFTLEKIKDRAKAYAASTNDSLTPGLIDTNVSEAAGTLLAHYINIGLIKKRLANPAAIAGAANPYVYILNPAFKNWSGNKRYAVEAGAVKWLGNLDKNYSSYAAGKIVVMPADKWAMQVTKDGEKDGFNEKVLEKVLLNSENALLDDGTLIAKGTSWNETLSSYVGRNIVLGPGQYVNYMMLSEKFAEEEDKKKKKN